MRFLFLPALSKGNRWAPTGIRSQQFYGDPPRRKSPMDVWRFQNWMDTSRRGNAEYYPHALVSYYIFRGIPIEFSPDGYIFGDSGGFSAMSAGMDSRWGTSTYVSKRVGKVPMKTLRVRKTGPQHARMDPADVLRWQAARCSTGVVLDFPPVTPQGQSIWDRALQVTERNVKRAVNTYKELREQGTPFRWWGVVHGWTEDQLDTWWSRIHAHYPFEDEGEGWGTKARPVSWDAAPLALRLHWMQRRGIKRAHFFAAAVPSAMIVLMILGREAGMDFITCDASTGQLQGAKYRRILLPGRQTFGGIEEKGLGHNARDYLLNECSCVSCREAQQDFTNLPDELMRSGYNEYWTYRFIFHNTMTLLNTQRQLEEEARSSNPEATLRDVLGVQQYGAVMRAFEGHYTMPALTRGSSQSLLEWL